MVWFWRVSLEFWLFLANSAFHKEEIGKLFPAKNREFF